MTPQQMTRETNDAEISKIHYLDTATAYDLWSQVYDTDGNFLQALDTIEMKTLLPSAIQCMTLARPWKVVDLGCGTGRNTSSLMSLTDIDQIVALDLSSKMLEVAEQRIQEHKASTSKKVSFQVFDMIKNSDPPEDAMNADLMVSTLVVEHVPLDIFFSTATKMLKPGGLLLLTNMHSEMGNISQAGFMDPKTGEKIRPVSYPHTTTDVKAEAARQNLELIDNVKEVDVDEALAEKLGQRGKKWIGVTVWFGGLWKKRA